MPKIYISPSVDESSLYVGGGNDEYYMNQIVDAMVPYLTMSGIQFKRNNPNDTMAQIIEQSNSENYDLHLVLRTNTSSVLFPGGARGPSVYYPLQRADSLNAATIFTNNLKIIYTPPNLVATIPSNLIYELNHVRATSILVSLGYHDYLPDVEWIKNNIYEIARNIVLSLTDYFIIPLQIPPGPALPPG